MSSLEFITKDIQEIIKFIDSLEYKFGNVDVFINLINNYKNIKFDFTAVKEYALTLKNLSDFFCNLQINIDKELKNYNLELMDIFEELYGYLQTILNSIKIIQNFSSTIANVNEYAEEIEEVFNILKKLNSLENNTIIYKCNNKNTNFKIVHPSPLFLIQESLEFFVNGNPKHKINYHNNSYYQTWQDSNTFISKKYYSKLKSKTIINEKLIQNIYDKSISQKCNNKNLKKHILNLKSINKHINF